MNQTRSRRAHIAALLLVAIARPRLPGRHHPPSHLRGHPEGRDLVHPPGRRSARGPRRLGGARRPAQAPRGVDDPLPRRLRVVGDHLHASERQQPRQALPHGQRQRRGDARLRWRRPARPLLRHDSRAPAGSPDGFERQPALPEPGGRHLRGRHRAGGGRVPGLHPRPGGRRRRRQRLARPVPGEPGRERTLPQQGRRHLPRRRRRLWRRVRPLDVRGGDARLRRRRPPRPLRLMLRQVGPRRGTPLLRRPGEGHPDLLLPPDRDPRTSLLAAQPGGRHLRGRHRAGGRPAHRRPGDGRRRRRRQSRRPHRSVCRERHVPELPVPQPGRRHVRGPDRELGGRGERVGDVPGGHGGRCRGPDRRRAPRALRHALPRRLPDALPQRRREELPGHQLLGRDRQGQHDRGGLGLAPWPTSTTTPSPT